MTRIVRVEAAWVIGIRCVYHDVVGQTRVTVGTVNKQNILYHVTNIIQSEMKMTSNIISLCKICSYFSYPVYVMSR